MTKAIHVENRGNFIIKIFADECVEDPRKESEKLTTILYSKSVRKQYGDRSASSEEMEEIINNPDFFARPIFAYLHGNVSFSLSSFNDRWDSGCSGVIYISKEDAAKNDLKSEEEVIRLFEADLKTYEMFCNGEVYEFTIENKNGEAIDSLYGCYGFENCKEEAYLACDGLMKMENVVVGKFESNSSSVSLSSIVFDAFGVQGTIGTKVLNRSIFLTALLSAADSFDFGALGQGVISIPGVEAFVSCGIGKAVDDEDCYVLRSHRGRVGAYLKRRDAFKSFGVSAVVYTKAAYLKDPDCDEEEIKRIEKEDPKYVLVAVLSNPEGYKSQMSPYRFVKNLAGGNNNELTMSADEIRSRAREIVAVDDGWCVVAD